MKAWINALLSLCLICVISLSSAASACIAPSGEFRLHANYAVFSGTLIEYEVVIENRDDPHNWASSNWAVLTYKVDDTLRGDLPDEIAVFWSGPWGGGPPATITVPSREIVRLYPPNETIDQYGLVTHGCGYLEPIPLNDRNLALAKEALASGTKEPIGFETDGFNLVSFSDPDAPKRTRGSPVSPPDPVVPEATAQESSREDRSWAFLAGFVLFALGAAIALFRRSKPKRS